MRKATLVSLTLVLATAAVGMARIQTPAAAAGVGTQASPVSGLALDQIKMAPGFKIELFATGVTNAREMALGSNGTVFVGSRNKPAGDTVYAVVDQNGDYKADQVIPIAIGHTTYQSLQAATNEMQRRGLHSAFLVSDPWHNARITAMASDLGIDGYASATWTSAAESETSRGEGYLRETFAYLYYRILGD